MITSTFFCISLTLICFTNALPINQTSDENLVEGDMIFPRGFNPKSSARGVAIAADARKWPNGIVPYDISAITERKEQEEILYAMNTLMYDVGTPIPNVNQRRACVYFRPRTNEDKVYLKIQYGDGCFASVGYFDNRQQPILGLKKYISLTNSGCFYSDTIQHELLHVLGFFHEQSRPDRDDYLQINLDNVDPNQRHNFEKYTWDAAGVLNQGSPYDYSSIMHYGRTYFSMNGQETMIPRRKGISIGHAKELSPIDIAEVRHYYKCDV